MVVNFDLRLFCENLKATKPPYECPVEHCGKIYKTFAGIQFHLYNYNHDSAVNGKSPPHLHNPSHFESKGPNERWHHRQINQSPVVPDFLQFHEEYDFSLTKSRQTVEVNLNGKIHCVNRFEPLEILACNEMSRTGPQPSQVLVEKIVVQEEKECYSIKMPVAEFRILEEHVKQLHRVPQLPTDYYKYVEKTAEELNNEVEYDMDEEDYAWLELLNELRKEQKYSTISHATFELIMDRFEKEAFFLSQSPGIKERQSSSTSVDEDAVCAICMDGECQNTNVILFCDMCNLAVHQECYGVPYIPEGQWLCRRCLQSPSRAVDCCLCPNKGGAFKQTNDGRWAHVICALWIPEVCFANTVFLEPIDSIENIPSARWRLTCYVCKQRHMGACIQCHRTNCYTAFHVTCAQQAGLYMKIFPIREPGINGISVTNVCKTAFCDMHAPPDVSPYQPMIAHSFDDDDDDDDDDDNDDEDNDGDGEDSHSATTSAEAKAISRDKIKQARKILAEKRKAAPAVSVPVISNETLMRIALRINFENKEDFLKRLKSYWTLKRQSRNGVPLLRRLQTNHLTKHKEQMQDFSKGIGLSRKSPCQLRSKNKIKIQNRKMLDSKEVAQPGDADAAGSESKGFAHDIVDSECCSGLGETMQLMTDIKPLMKPTSRNLVNANRSLQLPQSISPINLLTRCLRSDEAIKVENSASKEVTQEYSASENKANGEKAVADDIWIKIALKESEYDQKKTKMANEKRTDEMTHNRREAVSDIEQMNERNQLANDEIIGGEKEDFDFQEALQHNAQLRKSESMDRIEVIESMDIRENVMVEKKKENRTQRKKKKQSECELSSDIAKRRKEEYDIASNVDSSINCASFGMTKKNIQKDEEITDFQSVSNLDLLQHLKHWKNIRHGLERARLLVELIQKREKTKLIEVQTYERIVMLQLKPFPMLLLSTLDRLQKKDTKNIFAEPVSVEEVPDYLDHIHYPMDFSTMQTKIETHQYRTMDEFQADFDLIISNCLTYNAKGTIYYSAAMRLRDQGNSILQDARRLEAAARYDFETGVHLMDRQTQSFNSLTLEIQHSYICHGNLSQQTACNNVNDYTECVS